MLKHRQMQELDLKNKTVYYLPWQLHAISKNYTTALERLYTKLLMRGCIHAQHTSVVQKAAGGCKIAHMCPILDVIVSMVCVLCTPKRRAELRCACRPACMRLRASRKSIEWQLRHDIDQ